MIEISNRERHYHLLAVGLVTHRYFLRVESANVEALEDGWEGAAKLAGIEEPVAWQAVKAWANTGVAVHALRHGAQWLELWETRKELTRPSGLFSRVPVVEGKAGVHTGDLGRLLISSQPAVTTSEFDAALEVLAANGLDQIVSLGLAAILVTDRVGEAAKLGQGPLAHLQASDSAASIVEELLTRGGTQLFLDLGGDLELVDAITIAFPAHGCRLFPDRSEQLTLLMQQLKDLEDFVYGYAEACGDVVIKDFILNLFPGSRQFEDYSESKIAGFH